MSQPRRLGGLRIPVASAFAVLALAGCTRTQTAADGEATSTATQQVVPMAEGTPRNQETPMPQSSPDSGVYGQVRGGGGVSPNLSFGVKGECIEVFDADSGASVAKGNCDESGKFRVALKPGRYVLSAAGQKRNVEVTAGGWLMSNFALHLP